MKNKALVVISMLMCAGLLILAIFEVKDDKNRQYEIVFFGDSVIAGDHNDSWSIPILVEKDLGLSSLNAAIGGTTLSDFSSNRHLGDVGAIYSMTAIARAIGTDDFSIQTMASQVENEYVDEWRGRVASELKQVCWDHVKFIIIEHGANDYLMGIPIDDENDAYNTKTFGGSLRTSIELLSKRSNAQIVIMTPIYMFPAGYDLDCYEMDFGGGTLDQYVQKEIEIAREYNAILIDDFNELDINGENYQYYIPGGLHGNLEGNQLIADNIIKHLKELDERD